MHIDAGKVNTAEGGWRDVKVADLARRRRGEGCDSAGLDQRDLPAPSARAVVAAAEHCEEFGRRVEEEALRVRAPPGGGLSVLGDGADWVWGIATDHSHGAQQVLDVWHGLEGLAKAGRAALGPGQALQAWLGQARGKLVGDGYPGACDALAELSADEGLGAEAGRAIAESLNYFKGTGPRTGSSTPRG